MYNIKIKEGVSMCRIMDFLNKKGEPIIDRLEKFSNFSIGQFLKNSKKAVTIEAQMKLEKKHDISLLGALAYAGDISVREIIKMAKDKSNPKIFSAIFFDDGSHMTYHFNPNNPIMPFAVKEGDKDEVKIIGRYEDEDCKVDIVSWKGLFISPFNTNVFHITREIKNISAFEAGNRANRASSPDNTSPNINYLTKPKQIIGHWGYEYENEPHIRQ